MIRSQELRLGNWVLYKGKHRIIQEIGKDGIDLYADGDGHIHAEVAFEELEGVPISPELLLDLRFEEMLGEEHDVIPKHMKEKHGELKYRASNYRKTIVKDGVNLIFEIDFKDGWKFQGQETVLQP